MKDTDDTSKPRGKRVKYISDSDDSDGGPFESKAKVAGKKPKVEEKIVPVVKVEAKAKVLKPVDDLKSVFGSQPIKKSNEPQKRKLPEDVHSDEDFQAALAQADALPLSKKSKVKSPVKEEKKKSHVSPDRNGNKPLKTVDLTENSPKKKSPKRDDKSSFIKKEKVSPIQEAKTTPKKKVKEEPVSKKTNKKAPLSTMTIDSPDKSKTIKTEEAQSPSIDPLEKRKQRAENYRKFLAGGHKEGAKNPGSKTVPNVSCYFI